MRLRRSAPTQPRAALTAGLVAVLMWGAQMVHAQDPAQPPSQVPTPAANQPVTESPRDTQTLADEQVQAAVRQVRDDPLWGRQTQEKTWRFKPPKDKPDPKADARGDDFRWLTDFLQSVSQAGRALVWLLGAAAVALLLVGARRWIKVRADAAGPLLADLPSRVSHLDIRPASLPDNVGDAASALWQRGEHRQALSLLYRGVLSRLVHQHAVPIVAASTEDECVALARTRLDPPRGAYVQRMVGAWARAVYGAELPRTELMLELCQEFAVHFAPVQAIATPTQGART